MFKEEDGLAGNNNEEYLRHFGFTVEDLSFLISPQSSLSPIKKKQRNVFNFEEFGDEIDTSAPVNTAPGPYPANYPTVYQETYDQASPYIKDEEQEPLPSFEGLDLTSFEVGNPDEYLEAPPTYGSNHAHAGSGASSIASEQIDIGFSRMGSSMGMGSLNFSTMSSFNFDEAEADELMAQTQQQAGGGRRPEGVADAGGRSASLEVNDALNVSNLAHHSAQYPPHGHSRAQHTMAPLPPLPPVTTSMCMEDASFIINAQQQQILHQKQLIEQQQLHRTLSGLAAPGAGAGNGSNSNKNSWNQQDFQRSGISETGAPTPPLSRIGSFKSTLPPLSVDMNALNAAHHAHQQAKLYQQTHGANSNNNSFSVPHHSNLSSSGRSSNNSSPERGSYLSDSNSNPNGRPKRVTEKERERRASFGNRSRDEAGLAATLLSLSNPASAIKDIKGSAEKEKEKDKGEDTRASKSLATISRRFVEHFGEPNTFEYISGLLHVNDVHDGPPVTNRVDGAAEVLGVHVRRIYELIKILEILSLVTFTGDKRGKFGWRGTKDFLMTLGAIQADGITKYPEVAYAQGLRMPRQPLQSPSAACGSPLTVSQPGTPVYMEGQTSPFFPASSGGSSRRGMHPGFGAHHLRSSSGDQNSQSTNNGQDRSAALALGGIGYESHSADPYDRIHLSGSMGSADNAYLEHINALPSLDVDLNASLDNTDLLPNSPDMRGSDIDTSEIDAFAAHLLSGEPVPMELASTAGAPKYSKKRTALKRSSKAAAASSASAATENHEEFMVEGICKSFLQLFLVGMDGLTMNFAIQKLVPMEPNQTLNEYNKVNATKIRRVYDVANVLCSLNLVNKITMTKKVIKSEVGTPDSTSHTSQYSRDSPLKDSYRNLNNSNTNNNNNSSNYSLNNSSNHNMNASSLHNISQYNNSNNNSSNNFDVTGSATKGARGEGKGDSKILEWGSFPPTVIRDYYLNKMCI